MRGATGVIVQLHQIAPATQNESRDWSTSHIERHLQCAEQAKSPFNLTKYCACHEILSSKFERLLPPIERWFEDNPRIIRPWYRHLAPAASETLLTRPILGTHFVWTKYNIWHSGYLPKFHKMLHLPRKVTLQLHQIAPATQNESHDWFRVTQETSFTMRSKQSHPSTSPSTAPATKFWILYSSIPSSTILYSSISLRL